MGKSGREGDGRGNRGPGHCPLHPHGDAGGGNGHPRGGGTSQGSPTWTLSPASWSRSPPFLQPCNVDGQSGTLGGHVSSLFGSFAPPESPSLPHRALASGRWIAGLELDPGCWVLVCPCCQPLSPVTAGPLLFHQHFLEHAIRERPLPQAALTPSVPGFFSQS